MSILVLVVVIEYVEEIHRLCQLVFELMNDATHAKINKSYKYLQYGVYIQTDRLESCSAHLCGACPGSPQ